MAVSLTKKGLKPLMLFMWVKLPFKYSPGEKNRSDKKFPFIHTYYRRRTPSIAVFGTFFNLDYALTK